MRLKTLAVSIAVIGTSTLALAQTTAPSTARVEITGSSIKRIASEGALPLQIISRAELEREGITTAEQVIMALSTNGNGLDNLASNADVVDGAARGNNGATSANLRGQGANATLILLNGRRVASHGLNGGQVDLNQIPMAAVDRIEILKDGASAIYGTDAIGGVINFILRNNFTGLSAQATADVTEAGGGDIFKVSAVAGFGDYEKDGYNLLATVSFSDNKVLRGEDRDFVNTFQSNRGLHVDTRGTPHGTILPFAGSIIPSSGAAPFLPGSTTVRASGGINALNLPGGAGCESIDGMAPYDYQIWDFPQAQYACAWDTGRAAVLQQPVENLNYVFRGTLKLGEHKLAAEITGSSVDSAKRFSNVQLTPATTRQYMFPRNANSAAVYDDIFNRLVAVFPSLEASRGLPIAYRWRCMECGPREIETTTDTQRFFIGIDGPIGTWDYKAGMLQATSESESKLGTGYYYTRSVNDASGNPLAYGITNALSTGLINPFLLPGQAQSEAGLAELAKASAAGVVLYGGKFTLTQIDAAVSGPLFKLPAGDVLAAFGVDFRNEEYEFNGDQRAASARPEILAAPFDDGNVLAGVDRDVKAVYAELIVPIATGLEAQLAVRRDDYSGFGSTTNPKVAVRYQPMQQLLFRGSYSTGFRVPTFNQIFNAPISAVYTGRDLVDPATCASGRPSTTEPGCEFIDRAADIITGGKSDLGPEEAEMQSVGFVFAPSSAFSIGMDWWKIDRDNRIQILSLQQLIDNYDLFEDRFFRDATGKLVAVDRRWINAGESVTEGIELNLRGAWDGMGAKWTAGLDGTYLLEKKSRVVASADFGESEVGKYTFGGDLGLRWKHGAWVTAKLDQWSATLSQTYRSGYDDQVLPGVASGRVSPPDWKEKVDSYVTYNLSASYTGIKNLTITGIIKNVLDEDPPFAVNYDSNTGAGSSWEPRVADPRGRAFALILEYKFF